MYLDQSWTLPDEVKVFEKALQVPEQRIVLGTEYLLFSKTTICVVFTRANQVNYYLLLEILLSLN